MNQLRKYALYFLILVYVSGGIGFLLKPDFFAPFTPLTLLLTCFVFLLSQSPFTLNYLMVFFSIALSGFLIEVMGVQTGFVFGTYSYGEALGYKIMGVPLTISINWALLISSSLVMSAKFFETKWQRILAAAAFVTILDILIERIAPQLDFWYFKSGDAGLQNYMAWFVISSLIGFTFYKTLLKGHKNTALIILVLQFFFFGLLFLFTNFNFQN